MMSWFFKLLRWLKSDPHNYGAVAAMAAVVSSLVAVLGFGWIVVWKFLPERTPSANIVPVTEQAYEQLLRTQQEQIEKQPQIQGGSDRGS